MAHVTVGNNVTSNGDPIVGIAVGDTEAIMTPEDAKELAKKLVRAADRAVKRSESPVGITGGQR